MKLPYEIWLLLMIVVGAILVTVTSKHFWAILKKRRKCSECYGLGGDISDDDGNWMDCPKCGGKN